jgi:hypothetical protein
MALLQKTKIKNEILNQVQDDRFKTKTEKEKSSLPYLDLSNIHPEVNLLR